MQSPEYEKEIYQFIESYFKEIDYISEFHLKFFINNEIQTIDLNMLLLHKFIFQAFNFLKNNMETQFSRFTQKLYQDVKNLIEYLLKFEKKISLINNIFENEFLNNLIEYKNIKLKIENAHRKLKNTSVLLTSLETQLKFFDAKTKEDRKEYKVLRGRLVDTIHNHALAKEDISKYTIQLNDLKTLLKDIFNEKFIQAKKSYLARFYLMINTKLYYLNKSIWLEANKNIKVISYNEHLGIQQLNLKIYIKNYLKHIDILKSQNYNELSKIENILKELDE